jgi:hypothetical protein
MSCEYSQISNFGPSESLTPENDPLTYCALSGLESGFNHTLGSGGSLLGPNSSQCQRFMSQYCSNNWDGVCEYLYNDNDRNFPNTVVNCDNGKGPCVGPGIGNSLTKGEILLRNTAGERFLAAMSENCVRVYEPFDPTVAFSPMIGKWVPNGNSYNGYGNCYGDTCVPIYDVDAKTIDNDHVMNRILNKPYVAIDILCQIYKNRVRTNKLNELKNTKLGNFFMNQAFLNYCKNH